MLDLIHSDVHGPMQTTTPSGNRYVMTMIDDYSGHTTVYLLKNKSEVPSKIREYVKYVQTKFRLTPKRIRADRGGEYTSENLKIFLRDEGIKMELTTPYTPQQNGRAERKNRSLVEMTRSMLADSGLPNLYWGEAIMTANHLQNRLPTADDCVTPYEKWNDRKPDYSYIRRFGCSAFTVIHDRQKLDDKARKLIFVGYEEGTKGYRLLDTKTNKITISRDVTFLEGDPHILPMIKGTGDAGESRIYQPTEVNMETIPQIVPEVDEPVESHEHSQNTELRRSVRVNRGKKPERLIETANTVTTDTSEPKTCQEALNSDKATVCQRTKHIATKYHFVRDLYQAQNIDVKYLPSEQMIADLLTKPLAAQKIGQLRKDILLI